MERTGFLNHSERSGCLSLDDLVGNGWPKKMVSQIYGEPGSGKSTISLISAVEILKSGRSVIYIDTESFSVERFRQIAGDDGDLLAERFYLYEPADYEQQASTISDLDKILSTKKVGMIIMDSATGLYRTELEHGQDSLQKLNRQMVILLGYAKKYDLPVLITNQVYMDINRNEFAPLGGTGLFHLCKVVLRIDRHDTIRRVRLVKHSSRVEGGYFDFTMVQEGIRVVGI